MRQLLDAGRRDIELVVKLTNQVFLRNEFLLI